MVAGGGAGFKKPVSLPWGKEGIGWRLESPRVCGSFGSYLGILRKHLVLPIPKTNAILRGGRNGILFTWQMYWPVCSWDLLALKATWPMMVSEPHAGSRRDPEACGCPGAS